MPISEAAAILGCSTRTIARRLAAGELRRQERDGRVLVAIPDSLRRPADRMVEAVQQDAAHMRQLSAAVTQATEQAGLVLREAVTQARADAAAAIERATQAEARGRHAWRVAALLGVAAVIGLTATVSVTLEAARSREEARQLAATVSEAAVRVARMEDRVQSVLAERDDLGGTILDLEYQLRTLRAETDTVRQDAATPEPPLADQVPAPAR